MAGRGVRAGAVAGRASSPAAARCPWTACGGWASSWPRRSTAIHGAGAVHHDLKPGNVLVTAADTRVVDAGIARAAAASPLTRGGGLVGDTRLPRTRATAERVGEPASDVFALGSVLLHAATWRAAVRDRRRRRRPPSRAAGRPGPARTGPGHRPGRRGLPAPGSRAAARAAARCATASWRPGHARRGRADPPTSSPTSRRPTRRPPTTPRTRTTHRTRHARTRTSEAPCGTTGSRSSIPTGSA